MKRLLDTESSLNKGTIKVTFLMSFLVPSIWKKPCDKPDLYLNFAVDGSLRVWCSSVLHQQSGYRLGQHPILKTSMAPGLAHMLHLVYEKAEVNRAMV